MRFAMGRHRPEKTDSDRQKNGATNPEKRQEQQNRGNSDRTEKRIFQEKHSDSGIFDSISEASGICMGRIQGLKRTSCS